MTWLLPMNLRTRLLGLVLMATLVPALLLGWRSAVETDEEIAAAVRSLSLAARSVAAELEHRVQGTAQLHYGLAHSRVLDDADPKACSAYLSEVREAYPQYTGILTALPDGRLHCDSLQTGRTLNVADRSYFQRARSSTSGLVVEPAFGRLTGSSVLQIVHAARDRRQTLRFVLVASLNLHRFAEESQRKAMLGDSELLLVDDGGRVMAWAGTQGEPFTPGSSISGSALHELALKGGTGELDGRDGQRRIWAAAEAPALRTAGLRLLLGQHREALVAAPMQRLRQGLVTLAGAALLLFAGVWSLAEWGIRRQVARITSMVNDLGAGDLQARIALPHPRGELGELMAVLNHTADSLQQHRVSIDELSQRLTEAHGREISERQHNEERLARMANFDSLTGLPNRTLFRDRLQHAMAHSRRSGQPCALMFLDIDRFKNINDSLGHDVGDRLLKQVSAVLASCVRDADSVGRRTTDAPADEVFRLGGDEFMILVEDVASADAVAAIADRVLRALDRRFDIETHELFISASIGITLYTGDAVDLDGLVKQADMAMYRSKDLGRDTYCFFDEKMNEAASQRHQLEVALRHALDRDEFRLYYQPKADLVSGRVTGVEALLRWQPAGQPMVQPDRFIGILEETGLIVPVGLWVLRQACGQLVAWQALGMAPMSLAVNLSARQFRHQDLVRQVAGVLADTGFPPERLEVELTESMLIDDSEAVLRILSELAAMGIRIAIDDFGTGQSSLHYLKRFNVDTLKIDRSFVRDTPEDAEDSAIAAAVIALGHALGLRVVAEGVETEAQLGFLRSHACDELQGYLLSRPLAPEAFPAWLEAQCPARVASPALSL
ncbi:MAG: EAL domain-containing protein [Rubrivivax sp.]|nr:EAL domain-containing protein [Rubrivivax sp.]